MIGCICFLVLMAVEWLLSCAIVKLITLCFGWGFSWLVATGVWLVFLLINALIKK